MLHFQDEVPGLLGNLLLLRPFDLPHGVVCMAFASSQIFLGNLHMFWIWWIFLSPNFSEHGIHVCGFFIFLVTLYAFQEQKGEILMQLVNKFISNCSSQITFCSICSKHLELTFFPSYFLGDGEMIYAFETVTFKGSANFWFYSQNVFFQYKIFFLDYLYITYNKPTFNIYAFLLEQIKSTPAGDISVVLNLIL